MYAYLNYNAVPFLEEALLETEKAINQSKSELTGRFERRQLQKKRTLIEKLKAYFTGDESHPHTNEPSDLLHCLKHRKKIIENLLEIIENIGSCKVEHTLLKLLSTPPTENADSILLYDKNHFPYTNKG